MKNAIIKHLAVLLFTGLLISINSCKNSSSTTNQSLFKTDENGLLEINISDLEEPSEVKLSELGVIDVRYILLETTDQSLISNVRFGKLLTNDNGFYVGENSKLLNFANDGKFVCQIGAQGNGPEEYSLFSDFTIDDKNNMAFILSQWQDKIIVYTLSGEFIKSIPSPEHTTHLNNVDGKILCYSRNLSGNIENSFDLIDYDGNILKSYPNKYKFNGGSIPELIINECFFYQKNGKLHLKETHSDTIFIFENPDFVPYMILNRDEKRFPTDLRIYNSQAEIITKGEKRVNFIIEEALLEAGNLIYSAFSYKKTYNEYLASTKGPEYYLKPLNNGIVNDIDGGPNVYFKAMMNDSTVVCWMNAVDFKNYIASDEFKNSRPKYPEKKAELLEFSGSIKDNDNPVIMLLSLQN